MTRFFPPSRIAKFRSYINGFRQYEGDSLYEAWEQFKELIRKCPHHGLAKGLLVQTFYNGLSTQNMSIFYSSAPRGRLSKMEKEEAYALLEDLAVNNHDWPTGRLTQRRGSATVNKVENYDSLVA